jgi:hypothetical protein
MSAPVSIGAMLRLLAGMVDTKDLTDWENRFLKNVLERTGDLKRTSILTGDQLEKLQEIYEKHFG